MKHINLLTTIIFVILTSFSFSQVPFIDLTFTGSFSGMRVPLDSILIINQSQLADTMLYGNDTVLRLEYETGIDEAALQRASKLATGEVYPNPSQSNASLDVFLPGNGEISILVSDINGRIILDRDMELARGLHRLTINGGRDGIYFITVTHDDESISKRMVKTGSPGSGKMALTHNDLVSSDNEQKDMFAVAAFPFSPGDILTFIGFAATDRDTLQDTPTENTEYIFIFTKGGFACPGIPTIDFGGQVYQTVQIGSQCWFRENLNIGELLNSSISQSNNEVVEKYCYDDLEENCDTYGGLYRWNEMMQYTTEPGSQGICPEGWHVPDQEEWSDLMLFLGGDRDAGGRLKEMGLEHWSSPNTDATNKSGFTALPGGQSEGKNLFTGMGTNAWFWCSSMEGLLNSVHWELRHNTASLVMGSQVRTYAKSVRCLKD